MPKTTTVQKLVRIRTIRLFHDFLNFFYLKVLKLEGSNFSFWKYSSLLLYTILLILDHLLDTKTYLYGWFLIIHGCKISNVHCTLYDADARHSAALRERFNDIEVSDIEELLSRRTVRDDEKWWKKMMMSKHNRPWEHWKFWTNTWQWQMNL